MKPPLKEALIPDLEHDRSPDGRISQVDGSPRDDERSLKTWLEAVTEAYPYSEVRGYDRIAPGIEQAYLTHATLAAAGASNLIRINNSSGRPLAVTQFRWKPMESDFFGVATCELSPPICPSDTSNRRDIIRQLLRKSLAQATERQIELVILRIDASDIDALIAAQVEGYVVCEATISYLTDRFSETSLFPLPKGLTVETYEGRVKGSLGPTDIHKLAEATSSWSLGHFSADPRISEEAIKRYYRAWIHNIADGSWSDCLFVARFDGVIAGIFSEVIDIEISKIAESQLRVGEWMVVVNPELGVGLALAQAAAIQDHKRGSHRLWETQLRNLPIIRRLHTAGVARPIRSGYTLHRWASD